MVKWKCVTIKAHKRKRKYCRVIQKAIPEGKRIHWVVDGKRVKTPKQWRGKAAVSKLCAL